MTRRLFILGIFLSLAPGCDEEHIVDAPPAIVVGIERIEFGAVAVGDVATREIVIQNDGAGYLLLDVPAIRDNPDFSFSVPVYDKEIIPGSQGTMSVNFGPREIAHYERVLEIKSNDRVYPVVEVLLSGDGYRRCEIEVEPRIVDFGKVNAGQVSLGEVFISSVGSGFCRIVGLGLSETTSPDFRINSSTQTPYEMPPGEILPIRLSYRPGLDSVPPDEGQLIIESDDPYNRKITVRLIASLNHAPLADAGEDQAVDPLLPVMLDGSGSYDPDGDEPLGFSWTLVRRPEGSASELSNPQTANPSFTPELVGVYEAELYVTDSTGLRSLLPDRVAVTAIPAERLLVELVWNSSLADLDLHLLAPGGIFGGQGDCYFGNREPDWGEQGDPWDDPFLKRDDLNGFGPETIGYNEPLDGIYRLVVDYFAAHTPSGQEPTTATLRIFVDGLLRAEISKRLLEQGERWEAATVQWPEGAVEEQE